jgi:hypothetical protein
MWNSWTSLGTRGCGPGGGWRHLGFRGAPPSLVGVIKHDIDEDVRWIVNSCALHYQRPQLLSKSIPTKELPEVDITDFQSTYVLERVERNCGVERELLIAFYKSCPSIWCKSKTWDFGEG